MISTAINHMTVPGLTAGELISLAGRTGCAGLEFRNDLGAPLFGKLGCAGVKQEAAKYSLRVLALAEVSAFNDFSDRKLEEIKALASDARDCGAEAIILIPQMTAKPCSRSTSIEVLRKILPQIQPVLAPANITGLIEPLGFADSTLRYKSDVAKAIMDLGLEKHFGIVHDTFHHFLTGDDEFMPGLTGLIHVSGVTRRDASDTNLEDADRVLVDDNDQLDNIGQLRALHLGGCRAPVSMEAFSPIVHNIADPEAALLGSFEFIKSQLVREAA